MKTYIRDDFPLEQLECQYLMVCKFYNPNECDYGMKCSKCLDVLGNKIRLRDVYGICLEKYIYKDCMKLQIKLIRGEGKKDE